MLILPIKKKWYDMILSGVKKEEYREIKPYYTSRFMHEAQAYQISKLDDGSVKYSWSECVEKDIGSYSNLNQDFFNEILKKHTLKVNVVFRNGYSNKSPSFAAHCELAIKTGKPEWGAEPNKKYYVLTIKAMGVANKATL